MNRSEQSLQMRAPKHFPLFNGFTDDDLVYIESISRQQDMAKGKLAVREGELGRHFLSF